MTNIISQSDAEQSLEAIRHVYTLKSLVFLLSVPVSATDELSWLSAPTKKNKKIKNKGYMYGSP